MSVNQQKSVAELLILVEALKAELTALRAYASRLEKIVAYMRSPDYDPTKPLPAHLTMPERSAAAAPAADGSSTPVPMAPSSSNASSSNGDDAPRPPSPQPSRTSDSGGKATPEKRPSQRGAGSAIGTSPAKAKAAATDKRGSSAGTKANPPLQASPSVTNLLVGVEAFDSFAESRMELAKLKESTAREITELNDKCVIHLFDTHTVCRHARLTIPLKAGNSDYCPGGEGGAHRRAQEKDAGRARRGARSPRSA